jgi:hypothetical protein
MEPETAVQAKADTGGRIMAAIEDGPVETFIIADISTDDAYLTLPLADAASLPAWR